MFEITLPDFEIIDEFNVFESIAFRRVVCGIVPVIHARREVCVYVPAVYHEGYRESVVYGFNRNACLQCRDFQLLFKRVGGIFRKRVVEFVVLDRIFGSRSQYVGPVKAVRRRIYYTLIGKHLLPLFVSIGMIYFAR